MRFKKRPQLPGAGRTRAWHHHGSHTPTSPGPVHFTMMYLAPVCNSTVFFQLKIVKEPDHKMVKNTISKSYSNENKEEK